MNRNLPRYFRLRRALLDLLGLQAIPAVGGWRSRLREKLLTCGWPSNEGFHAQGGQDRYVDELLLDGRTGGTFIEIGANDGETFSNCLFFEEQRQWSGVCVEPNPAAFAKLKKRRPDARLLQVAVGTTCDTIVFPIFTNAEESLYASVGKNSTEGTVPVDQLDLPSLFERTGLTEIDLLSIDVEGDEEKILATLADTSIRPEIICAEENTTPETLDRTMAELGYQIEARVWPDRIYRIKQR